MAASEHRVKSPVIRCRVIEGTSLRAKIEEPDARDRECQRQLTADLKDPRTDRWA